MSRRYNGRCKKTEPLHRIFCTGHLPRSGRVSSNTRFKGHLWVIKCKKGVVLFHVDYVNVIVPMFHTAHIHGGVRARFEDSTSFELDYKILENLVMEGSASSKISVRTVDAWDFFQPKKGESVADTLLRFSPLLPADFLYPMVAGAGVRGVDYAMLETYTRNFMFIEIRGNLIKFFQGHSLYGSLNHCGLIVDFCCAVLEAFNIVPLATDVAMWRQGGFYPKELHICANYRLSDYQDVDRFIHGIVKSCSLYRSGFRFDHNEKREGWTAVHKTRGEMFRLSAYNKFCDLRDHSCAKPSFEDEQLNRRLLEHSNGILRFETKLKSRWFRSKNIYTMHDLYRIHPDVSAILDEQLQAIETGGCNLKSSKLELLKSELPSHILPTFLFWFEGYTAHGIKTVLGGGHRTAAGDKKYYRASRFLREHHDINTKVRRTDGQQQSEPSNVVPLIRTLEACPDTPPQWMRDEGLIYEPSEHLLTVVK